MTDEEAIGRLSVLRFGEDALRGRRILTAWRETDQADWCVAVVAGADGTMLIEILDGPEESFAIREPLTEQGMDRVFSRLMSVADATSDQERRVEMVRRYASLLDAFAPLDPEGDDLPAALVASSSPDRDWVIEEMRRLGREVRPDAVMTPGHC